MIGQELSYTVLVHEDRFGVWLKVPEFDLQILTEDREAGLDLLEEQFLYELSLRRVQGESVPERLVRTIKHVDRGEYGPTLVELEERRRREERVEESDEPIA